MLTSRQVTSFHQDGFVLVPRLFSQTEVDILLTHVGTPKRVNKHQFALADASGRARWCRWAGMYRGSIT